MLGAQISIMDMLFATKIDFYNKKNLFSKFEAKHKTVYCH